MRKNTVNLVRVWYGFLHFVYTNVNHINIFINKKYIFIQKLYIYIYIIHTHLQIST